MTKKSFSEEEFLEAIKSSKSHIESCKKLGYSQDVNGSTSRYTNFLKILKPDLSHFGNFSEEQFLEAIKNSQSHLEAHIKLGYKNRSTCSLKSNTLYGILYNKLLPDISHFSNFTETDFLKAIKSSYSHTEASMKLGYSNRCTNKNSLYGKFLDKLKPDISHFSRKRWNISHHVTSKEYGREYYKIRKKYDINFKLKKILRCRFRAALRQNSKKGSAVSDLGCSIEKFKLWMEMNWSEGMSWDNYGRNGWVIDHVEPLCSFDLSDRNQLLEACHFSNLQPMWADENSRKSGKF